MTDFNEEYINRVSSSLTIELLAILEDYADRKISRYNFVVGGNSTTEGLEAQDFVSEAIISVFKGVRLWDENTDFLVFMKGVIKSKISHAYTSKESRSTQRESTISYFKADEQEAYTLDCHVDSGPSPSQNAINSDAERKLWDVMEFLGKDSFLSDIFQLTYDGITKPAEIALALKTTTKEVNNGKKRLAIRLKKYRENQLVGGEIK